MKVIIIAVCILATCLIVSARFGQSAASAADLFALSNTTLMITSGTTATPLPDGSCVTQSFDSVVPANWVVTNNSNPVGTRAWFQGNGTIFSAQAGANNAYAAANFNSTEGAGDISTWLLSPVLSLRNGSILRFSTRKATPASTEYPDRLQVRLSTNGSSSNVGTTSTSVGDFTSLLIDINPNLVAEGYPFEWQEYTITLSGLSAPTSGRIAFRYFVPNGGELGANSDYIGVDSFSLCPNVGASPTATRLGSATPLRTATTTGSASSTPRRTATPVVSSTVAPPPGPDGPTWTFMLYLDGDTSRIDSGVVHARFAQTLQLLKGVTHSQVRVVALVDGGGGLDTYRVTYSSTGSDIYQGLGERAMDDPATLVSFVQEARQEFPADHYYLVIADHANGIDGIAWDTTTMANQSALLTPAELQQAFATITNNGAQPIDIVHFDGCSFGLLEDAAMTYGAAKYVVASENIGWSVFAYSAYRAAVTPATTPASLAQAIVQIYATQITNQELPYTISALDMNQFDAVLPTLRNFADALSNFGSLNQTNRNLLLTLRNQSQKFDSGGSPALQITNTDAFLDLADFATRVGQTIRSNSIPETSAALLSTLRGTTPFVIAEAHLSKTFDYGGDSYTWELDGAQGVSIYYPINAGSPKFTAYINGITFPNFNQLSHWNDYLTTGVPPLSDGEPLPDDDLEPLAPLLLPTNVYLPITMR